MMIARTALLGPIEHNKATDQVVKRITEAIATGVLKAGEQLPVESELAIQFNVAQMTLRQALSILRQLGFIETVRGRNGGSFVSSAPLQPVPLTAQNVRSLDQVRDLIDYKMAVENEAASLAAIRADAEAISRIKANLEACLKSEPTSAQHLVLDNSFHVSIAEAANSKKLVQAASEVQFETSQIYIRLDFPNEHDHYPHQQDHIEIVKAIESGDAGRAWEASNAHGISVLKYMSKIIEQKN